MQCPSCGAEASGNFCSACGAALKTEQCPKCGAEVLASGRFCTACGSSLSKGVGGSSPADPQKAASANATMAWWVAGAAMVIVLLVLGYPALTRGEGAEGTGGAPPGMGTPSGGAGAVDLTTMSLEDQSTVLFNRVMTSSSAGDTADVAFFQPKALVIYEQLAPTDPDGLYHFALLHQVGGDHAAAVAKAQEGLAQVPTYLLLLAVAAESSAALGDAESARSLYSRFLEVYDEEMGLLRPGYEHHQPIFTVYRSEAEAFLSSG